MADVTTEEKQDGQKTLVSFIVGLLIGGMLVWAFSGPAADAPSDAIDAAGDAAETVTDAAEDMADDAGAAVSDAIDSIELPTLPVGDGSVTVNDQPAGTVVALDRATYPVSEGWIGVQDYNDGEFGALLGVVAFSEAAGVVPETIPLQFPTTAGRQYAIVIYTSDGVRGFSTADTRIDEVFDTFTAQ